MRAIHRVIAFATTLAVLSTAAIPMRVALAEPTAGDKETARTLMAEGRAKRADGDHKSALEAFQRAHAIMNVPTTGLEVGREQEALGLLTEARDTYLAVSRMDALPSDPKPFIEAREEAERLADAIASRIPAVKIGISGVPAEMKTQIAIDGVEVSSAIVGTLRKIDPGAHEIVVTLSARETLEKKQSVELTEGQSKDVDFAFTPEEIATLAPKVEATKTEEPTVDLPPELPPQKRINVLTYVGFGVAGASVLVGTITGLISLSKASSAKSSCIDDKCPPSTHDDISTSKSMATVSTLSFVFAGVGAVVGVYGLLSPKSIPAEPASSAKIEPHVSVWIGVGSAGLVGAF